MSTSEHLKKVRYQLYRNLISCYKGWWQWNRILKTDGVEKNTAVVLLPSLDRVTNRLALLYLDEMLKSGGYRNAVLLTHDPAVKKSAALFSQNILHVVDFSRESAEHLMQFYCLYEFDRRFICASLDEPNGRNGSALIGKLGTTLEEVFVIGVYRLYPFERREPPEYAGDDVDIKYFLEGLS